MLKYLKALLAVIFIGLFSMLHSQQLQQTVDQLKITDVAINENAYSEKYRGIEISFNDSFKRAYKTRIKGNQLLENKFKIVDLFL